MQLIHSFEHLLDDKKIRFGCSESKQKRVFRQNTEAGSIFYHFFLASESQVDFWKLKNCLPIKQLPSLSCQ